MTSCNHRKDQVSLRHCKKSVWNLWNHSPIFKYLHLNNTQKEGATVQQFFIHRLPWYMIVKTASPKIKGLGGPFQPSVTKRRHCSCKRLTVVKHKHLLICSVTWIRVILCPHKFFKYNANINYWLDIEVSAPIVRN